MKKFIPFVLLCIGSFQFAQAQVVELIGMGVKDVNSPVLVIPNPGTVDHVVVEAAGVFRTYRGEPEPTDVQFYDSDETPAPSAFMLADIIKTIPIPDQKWGHYTATFNTVDAGGITLNNTGQEAYIVSITAYIYRTGGPGIYSEAKGDRAFVYQNGSGDPVVYNFTIPFSFVPRDVVVSVPFSDVNADGRYSVIDVAAGSLSTHVEFDDNNSGERLHLETVTLPNVPGNVTEVSVSIYSPNKSLGDLENGDSFLTSAVVLTTTYEEDGGCTLTQGYWKTHSEYGPASKPDETWAEVGGPDATFFLSGQTYLEVLNTPVKGNPYYTLAHQYIAAELNMLAGVYVRDIEGKLDTAMQLFNTFTPEETDALKNNDNNKKLFKSLAGVLDDFNNGIIGPGHCGDEYEDLKKSAVIDDPSPDIRELSVYPNPIKGIATLSFKPAYDGNASVDVYNSSGQKTLTLFNQSVRKDLPVNLMFDGNQLNEGLYVITLQNGPGRESIKVQIHK
jgi:hypothetical protein